MVNIESEDRELNEKFEEQTETDERYPEIQKDEDGHKRFKGLIIVPKLLEQEIIQRYHTDIREGHPGEARTVEKIERNFYFPGIMRKVRKFIRSCDDFQRNKPTREKPYGKMQKSTYQHDHGSR